MRYDKILIGIIIFSISILLIGCTGPEQAPELNEETQETPTTPQTSTPQGGSTGSGSQSSPSSSELSDVVLADFVIYDQSLKQEVETITASNPTVMSITIKNVGDAPYVDSKNRSPIIITMITQAYDSNIYFYNSNTSALNPGEDRTYKTNSIKSRHVGTFDAKIYPSIQYQTIQPEESSVSNNEFNTELTVVAR